MELIILGLIAIIIFATGHLAWEKLVKNRKIPVRGVNTNPRPKTNPPGSLYNNRDLKQINKDMEEVNKQIDALNDYIKRITK